METIALTSERNRDFLTGSGCYRHTQDAEVPTLYLDFSGDRELLRIVEGQGLEVAQQVFAQLLAGAVTPQEGHVIRL